jgi:hypothetical protein
MYPFLPLAEMGTSTIGVLTALFTRQAAVEVEFSQCCRDRGFLFLRPTPLQEVVALADRLRQQWPRLTPYDGLYGENVEPHLTIAIGAEVPDAERLEATVSEELPLVTTLREAWLVAAEGGQWTLRERFPFGAAAVR